jgi:hypothetical protein
MRTDVGVRLSSGVATGSMVVVAPESKMIRGDKGESEVASLPEVACAVRRASKASRMAALVSAAHASLISSTESTVAVAATTAGAVGLQRHSRGLWATNLP